MELSTQVKEQAVTRSGGVCECRREGHKHFGLTDISTPRCAVKVDMHSEFRELDIFTDINTALNVGALGHVQVICASCYQGEDSHAA